MPDEKNWLRLSRRVAATSEGPPTPWKDIFWKIEKYIFAIPVVSRSSAERLTGQQKYAPGRSATNLMISNSQIRIGLKPLCGKGFKRFLVFRSIFIWTSGSPSINLAIAAEALLQRGLREFQRG